MSDEPKLSAAEWALVVELLKREQHELPAEIHHTRLASYRKELHEREALVDRLVERLEKAS